MRKFQIVAMMVAAMSMPLAANAQSRYDQSRHQNTRVVQVQKNKHVQKQVVVKRQQHHRQANKNDGLSTAIVGLSALALLATIANADR